MHESDIVEVNYCTTSKSIKNYVYRIYRWEVMVNKLVS